MNVQRSKNGRTPINLEGQRFGRLLVLEYLGQNKYHTSLWECRCDCGKMKAITSNSLRNGRTQSCGCLQKEKVSRSYDERSRRSIYFAIRAGAIKRNINFDLDEDYVISLSQKSCFYCGNEPSNSIKGIKYNGLDRQDNSQGYVLGNVVPCCPDCNYAKRKMSVQKFTKWIDNLSKSRFFVLRKFGGSHSTLTS